MGAPKIDSLLLRKLWQQGVSSAEIAERFGVNYSAVNMAAKRLGLPARPRAVVSTGTGARRRGPQPDAPPAPTPTPDMDALSLDQALAVARGYADLQRIAERFRLSQSCVLSRWHRRRA